MTNEYLLRVWGRDMGAIEAMRPADLKEEDGVLCYWFPTAKDRERFIESCPTAWVMRSTADPGVDREGEVVLPRCLTVALVTLRFPDDGGLVSFEMPFGYGYPEHAVHYIFEEGNYSCDCNRRIFAEDYCGRPPLAEDAQMCGETIELVSLAVEKRPIQVNH